VVRKRRKQRITKGPDRKRRAPLSTGDLEAHATDLLENQRYKEAIAAFKDLLHRERRQPWLTALSKAYAGRAEELAGKGMIKEALAIWRGRSELCGTPLVEPAYIELLIQAGQIDTAIGVLKEHPDEPEIQRYLPGLRALAAAQALAGRDAVLDFFPGDDPVVRDFPAALAALQAYCQSDDGAVETHLKAIPFRSPYRDLRQILKALLRFDTDEAGAERSLARIDSGSPFSGICNAMRAARLPNPEFMRRCGELNPAERRFATALRGWAPQQVKRVLELRQLGDQPRPDALMRFLLRHREPLGQDWVRETAMRLLVHQPGEKGHYNRAFGKMSEFHRHRIQALHLEEYGDAPDEIFNTWREAYLALNQPTGSPDTDSELTGAMLLRHSVDRWLRTEPHHPITVKALELSLTLDPVDVPTYLKLIRHYRDAGELKDARRVLDTALDRYPEDAAVLTEAVETAIAGNAFKKAARFARKALERDPINARVRDILVESHLSHARKQIRQGKNTLARKELDEAANWARTEVAKGRIDNLRGVLEVTNGDPDTARERFLSGFERTGGGLVGRLYLHLEAQQSGQNVDTFMGQAQLPTTPRKPARKQVLALAHALNELSGEDDYRLGSALESMAKPLEKAAGQDFTLNEMELICETWLRTDHSDLRLTYARTALKRWPGSPTFVFHHVDAAHDGYIALSPREVEALDKAFDRAREAGDERSAHRIGELLRTGSPFAEPDDPVFDPFADPGFPEGLPESADLNQIIDLVMSTPGPPEIERLKRELGPEEARRALEAILLVGIANDDPADLFPEPSAPKPRRGSRKKPRKANPDQFELF